jgi:hypothetical protein
MGAFTPSEKNNAMSQSSEKSEEAIALDVIVDWVENSFRRSQLVVLNSHEEALATVLIKQAFENAQSTNTPVGLSLAAAFDLFVAAEYYKRVTHRGWFYCPTVEPLIIYPFTNACTRCILKGEFYYHRANKPESGQIGQATSRLLCVFLDRLFARTSRELKIYRGYEPVDLIIYEPQQKLLLLAEIKAAPLTTLALAVPSELLTDTVEGEIINLPHRAVDNAFLASSQLHLLLPVPESDTWNYRLINLGTRNNQNLTTWFYDQLTRVFDEDATLFADYFQFWIKAFEAYKVTARLDNAYWLTNGCGQPFPRPSHWPKRKTGDGYESISDTKTSVGMDRTDDIKKGIYQVLKIGAESKPKKSHYDIKTALISNIHAVRHYDEYLLSLQDIVWTLDESHLAKKASDLPPEAPIYNLFDRIVSFTEIYARDAWIRNNFQF